MRSPCSVARGLDEIPDLGDTFVGELRTVVSRNTLSTRNSSTWRSMSTRVPRWASRTSKGLLMAVLGKPGPACDIVVLNAGAAPYTANAGGDIGTASKGLGHPERRGWSI